MPEYRVTRAAETDLEEIWRHTHKTWGLAQADRYIDKLAETFQYLAENPMQASACDHIRRGYRRALVENHVIYFRLADGGIDIIRVLHERMDAPRHL